MPDNPYSGKAGYETYEQAWNSGYHYGFDNPHVTDYPAVAATLNYWPGPLYSEEQEGWLKAAAAYLAEEGTVTLTEVGLVVEGVTVAGFFAAVGEGLAVGAILFLVSGGGQTYEDLPHTDPAEIGTYLAHKCSEAGCTEFFLPYCTAVGHAGGSDDIFHAGLWHGLLYYDHDNAVGESRQHVVNEHHWGHTGVLHYLPSEPNYMEWITLTQT